MDKHVFANHLFNLIMLTHASLVPKNTEVEVVGPKDQSRLRLQLRIRSPGGGVQYMSIKVTEHC